MAVRAEKFRATLNSRMDPTLAPFRTKAGGLTVATSEEFHQLLSRLLAVSLQSFLDTVFEKSP